MADSETTTPGDDPWSANAMLNGMEEACSNLCFHMDNSVWDVIHDEVMDWRDSSWTSMNLPGNKTCENIVRPLCHCSYKGYADLWAQP